MSPAFMGGLIVQDLVDRRSAQFEGMIERAPLDTRVATVTDLFERSTSTAGS